MQELRRNPSPFHGRTGNGLRVRLFTNPCDSQAKEPLPFVLRRLPIHGRELLETGQQPYEPLPAFLPQPGTEPVRFIEMLLTKAAKEVPKSVVMLADEAAVVVQVDAVDQGRGDSSGDV